MVPWSYVAPSERMEGLPGAPADPGKRSVTLTGTPAKTLFANRTGSDGVVGLADPILAVFSNRLVYVTEPVGPPVFSNVSVATISPVPASRRSWRVTISCAGPGMAVTLMNTVEVTGLSRTVLDGVNATDRTCPLP